MFVCFPFSLSKLSCMDICTRASSWVSRQCTTGPRQLLRTHARSHDWRGQVLHRVAGQPLKRYHAARPAQVLFRQADTPHLPALASWCRGGMPAEWPWRQGSGFFGAAGSPSISKATSYRFSNSPPHPHDRRHCNFIRFAMTNGSSKIPNFHGDPGPVRTDPLGTSSYGICAGCVMAVR